MLENHKFPQPAMFCSIAILLLLTASVSQAQEVVIPNESHTVIYSSDYTFVTPVYADSNLITGDGTGYLTGKPVAPTCAPLRLRREAQGGFGSAFTLYSERVNARNSAPLSRLISTGMGRAVGSAFTSSAN